MKRLEVANPGLKGLLVHVRAVRALYAKGPSTAPEIATALGTQVVFSESILRDLREARLAKPAAGVDGRGVVELTHDGTRFAEHLVALDQFTRKLHEVREV